MNFVCVSTIWSRGPQLSNLIVNDVTSSNGHKQEKTDWNFPAESGIHKTIWNSRPTPSAFFFCIIHTPPTSFKPAPNTMNKCYAKCSSWFLYSEPANVTSNVRCTPGHESSSFIVINNINGGGRGKEGQRKVFHGTTPSNWTMPLVRANAVVIKLNQSV